MTYAGKSEGLRVLVNDVDGAAAEAVAKEIGGVAAPGDCASEAGVSALVARADAEFGGVDIWFGNAGITGGFGLDASEADWTRCLDVNVMAHVRAARLLIPRWVAQGGGRFVVTASAAGLLTMLGSPTYSTSKHAVIGGRP